MTTVVQHPCSGEAQEENALLDIGDPLYDLLTKRLRLSFRSVFWILIVVNLVRSVLIPIYYHNRYLGEFFFFNLGYNAQR